MGISKHARSGYYRHRRSWFAPLQLLGKNAVPELMHNMGMHADTLTLAYAANGAAITSRRHSLARYLRSALPHLVGCVVVPPDSRILERFADFGLEQQNMVRALEMHW